MNNCIPAPLIPCMMFIIAWWLPSFFSMPNGVNLRNCMDVCGVPMWCSSWTPGTSMFELMLRNEAQLPESWHSLSLSLSLTYITGWGRVGDIKWNHWIYFCIDSFLDLCQIYCMMLFGLGQQLQADKGSLTVHELGMSSVPNVKLATRDKSPLKPAAKLVRNKSHLSLLMLLFF